jgi:subfamily B ATP-binding cassette protein MsbA
MVSGINIYLQVAHHGNAAPHMRADSMLHGRISTMHSRGGGGRFQRAETVALKKNPFQDFGRMLPWMKPYWPVVTLGVLCMGITTYISAQPPRLLAFTVDTVIGRGQYGKLPPVLLTMFGIFLGIALFSFLRTYWLHVAGQRFLNDLRIKLYAHFQKLPLTYYDSRQTGDLMSRLTGDVEQVEQMLEHGLDPFLMGLFGMGLSWYYIYSRYSPLLSWLILIPVPIIGVSIFFFSRKIRAIYRVVRDRVGDLNAKLQDNLSGIRVIKAFSREATEQALVTADSYAVMWNGIRAIRMWSSFGPAMGFVSNLGSLIVLAVGVALARGQQFSGGALIACWLYVQGFYQPINNLFGFFDIIQRSLAAGERLFEVLDTVPQIQDPESPVSLGPLRGDVEFRAVFFRYETGEEVLHAVSVTAKPGERIALVGRSGAGKSSFINLIPRFYDVVEGCVLVDGIDVRQVTQTELRKNIALVLQETFLFNGSIRDNLRFGHMDASDEELLAAAIAGNAHEFIEKLAEGYDTQIGERGVKLSGGQRQRLSIARAVLADPRILILDEATSSVDSESEFLIHQALERLMEGRTTFIIAHRLSTIKHADVILVLEDGEIVERGNHRELLHGNGLYAQMYRQQFWLDDLFKEEDDQLQVSGFEIQVPEALNPETRNLELET